jgi:hypothetical protein
MLAEGLEERCFTSRAGPMLIAPSEPTTIKHIPPALSED